MEVSHKNLIRRVSLVLFYLIYGILYFNLNLDGVIKDTKIDQILDKGVYRDNIPTPTIEVRNVPIVGEGVVSQTITTPTEEDILEEDRLGDMELLAQAEAGNQGVQGMRYVISVVLNRVDSSRFPDTIEEVIFQPGAFGVITDGAFDRAAWNMSPECFEAVALEMGERSDTGILYFNTKWVNGRNPWKYKGHWFSY